MKKQLLHTVIFAAALGMAASAAHARIANGGGDFAADLGFIAQEQRPLCYQHTDNIDDCAQAFSNICIFNCPTATCSYNVDANGNSGTIGRPC